MNHQDAMTLLKLAQRFKKRLEELGEKPRLNAEELIALSGRTNLTRGRSTMFRK